jgi:hypothetical protein
MVNMAMAKLHECTVCWHISDTHANLKIHWLKHLGPVELEEEEEKDEEAHDKEEEQETGYDIAKDAKNRQHPKTHERASARNEEEILDKSDDGDNAKNEYSVLADQKSELIDDKSPSRRAMQKDFDQSYKSFEAKDKKCFLCDYSTPNKYRLSRHVKIVDEKVKDHFSTPDNYRLSRHVKIVDEKVKDHKCELCNFVTGYTGCPTSSVTLLLTGV